jgi:hypothetical protein
VNTKTIRVDINWLDEIDGMSVQNAIKYLSTLNPSHTLSYWMEGDTHGCNVISDVSYDVPLTHSEIFAKLEKHYLKEIALYESARQAHLNTGRLSRAESCERLLAQLRSKLETAKTKYCAE